MKGIRETMNGNSEMPVVTFGEGCDYGMLDSILNGYHTDEGFGWGVRVWIDDVILTARWGTTSGDLIDGAWVDKTTLLVWNVADGEYTNHVTVLTDAIRKVEIL